MKSAQRAGFTLIELLIVVVVLGILATIAIPKFSRMRAKSYVAAVTSDMTEYRVSNNVIVSINEATGTGWAATGTHSGLAGAQCGIYFGSGSASNASPATSPGTVTCN